MPPVRQGYSTVQIALHWIVFLLIAVQFLFHEPMSEAWEVVEDGGAKVMSLGVIVHIAAGIAVALLGVWRLVLRFTRGAPDAPAGEAPLLRLAAHGTHMALYVLMIVVPLSGREAWGGGIEAAAEVHEALKTVLLLLVLLHAAAAIWHQFWLKDGLLDRMRRAER